MKIDKSVYVDSPTVMSDFIENLMLSSFDFKNRNDLYNIVWYILESGSFVNDDHLHYLDFDVNVDDDGSNIRIIANNIVTALWFSNIFPKDPDRCYIDNKYEDSKSYYLYDSTEKKLLIKRKVNNE